jgi:hypothetical protein
MECAPDLFPPESAAGQRLASWYTPGRVDGFGDRLLMFDHGDTDGLELLRFHPTLGAMPGFEQALRSRVERLATLRSPAFATIRAVERLESEASLALVSIHTPGRPFSALFEQSRAARRVEPAFVTWMVREAIAALTTLHRAGGDVGHGALNAERMIITPEGHLKIVEHVLGAALAHLNLTPAQLWSRFSLVVPTHGSPICRFDPRTDVFQIGVLALSMLIGRRINPNDVPQLGQLVEKWSEAASARGAQTQPLRRWLEMALQLLPGNAGYATAVEAYRDLRQLPSPPESSGLSLLQAMHPPAGASLDSPDGDVLENELPGSTPPLLPAAAGSRSKWQSGVPVWMAIVLTAIAVSEAALGLMLWRSSGGRGVALLAVDGSEAGTGPAGVDPSPTSTTGDPRRRDIELPRPRRALPRSGGLRLVSPIDLHVLEGDRLLGTTGGGTIVASVGTHDFELVNTALGIHLRQTVTFRPGQVTQLSLEIPRGRISVSADPWAEVLIDNESIGETPLANVDVALGQHAIVFRHPEYGERHESVVVRADVDAHVSATFEGSLASEPASP